jgi:hypothetical protein
MRRHTFSAIPLSVLAFVALACVGPPTALDLTPPQLGTRSVPLGAADVSVEILHAGTSADWSDAAFVEALTQSLVASKVITMTDAEPEYRLDVRVLQVDSYLLDRLTPAARVHSSWTLEHEERDVLCQLHSIDRQGNGNLVVQATRATLARGVESLVYFPPGNIERATIETRLVGHEGDDAARRHWGEIFEALVSERLRASNRFRSVSTASRGACGDADYSLTLELTALVEQAAQGKMMASGANLEATFSLAGSLVGEIVPATRVAEGQDRSYVERTSDTTSLAADRTAKVVVERVLRSIASIEED